MDRDPQRRAGTAIGVLTSSYPRHHDDWAGRFVAELAGWMAAQGDRLEVVAPYPAHSIDQAVTVHPLRYAVRPQLFYRAGAPDNLLTERSFSRRVRAWAQVPGFVGRLAGACWWHSRRWERLLSHWLLPCGVVAAAAGRGRPHLAIAHSSDVHLLRRLPGARGLLAQLARPRSALALTSETLREPLLRLTRPGQPQRELVAAASVVPMGVAASADPGPPPVAPLEGRPRVVFVGRLVPLKGVDLLIDACRGLRAELVVVGDGPERARLVELAGRGGLSARFVGEQGRSETARWLRSADLLVLPSRVLADGRTDSAPLAVMEALAAGVPVIASRVGGLEALVRGGVEGLLFPPGDVRGLREALVTLLDDPARRRQMGAAASLRAGSLSWDRPGKRLRGLLLSL